MVERRYSIDNLQCLSFWARFEWSRLQLTLGAYEALIAQWQSVQLQTIVLHDSLGHLLSPSPLLMAGGTLHLNYDMPSYNKTTYCTYRYFFQSPVCSWCTYNNPWVMSEIVWVCGRFWSCLACRSCDTVSSTAQHYDCGWWCQAVHQTITHTVSMPGTKQDSQHNQHERRRIIQKTHTRFWWGSSTPTMKMKAHHHAPCTMLGCFNYTGTPQVMECWLSYQDQVPENIIQSCQNMALLLKYILYIFHALKIHSMTHVGQGHGYPRVGEWCTT